MAPMAPSELDQRMQSAINNSHELVDLPFFSSMPDTSGDRRFSDTRKSQFVRQVCRGESKVRNHAPPPVSTHTVKPSATFCFRDTRGQPKMLPVGGARSTVPYVPGRGARRPSLSTGRFGVGPGMGCSEIFPRFDFNTSSSALSSAAYGIGVPNDRNISAHEPLREHGASVEKLLQRNDAKINETEARFKELQREIVANRTSRNGRKRADNHLTTRHESNSRAMAHAMQIF